MKPSKYNFIFPQKNDETILYNSLYGSYSILTKDELDIVKQVLDNPSALERNDSTNTSVLIEQKYLIEASTDEIEIIKNRKRAGIKDSNRLDLVVMPTLDCNFACKYCYETHRSSRMTDETEKSVIKWLSVQIPKYKFVMLHWYGGEPLLCYKRIISLSKAVADIAVESKISYVIHITTNGSLINNERVKGLIDAGIFDYQITLDGSPEAHNKLRVQKDGKDSFSRIFENINALISADERVRITLRINFNHDNIHTIPHLLEMFPISVRARLRVVFEPILGSCALSATDNLSGVEISEAISNYYEKARQFGYDIVLGLSSIGTGKLVYCYAERESQFIINYNADIYKCSVSDFTFEKRVGYIRSDGILVKNENWDKWICADLFEEKCYSCGWLPLCMGGCRKARLQHKNTGGYCSLVPTNASYLLKQISFGRGEDVLRKDVFKE